MSSQSLFLCGLDSSQQIPIFSSFRHKTSALWFSDLIVSSNYIADFIF